MIFLGLVLLVADTFVFQQFRLHINLAMLELTLLGGGQIVAFSPVMLLEIAALTVIIAFVSLVILKAAAGWSRKGRFTGTAAALVLAGFAVVNLTYAVSFPLKKSEVLTATDRIPYAQPLRMTKVLLKTGVITQADIEKEKTVSVGSSSGLDYPKKPFVCTGDVKPMNIVFLFVDALRSDVVTPENMPQLSAFARTQDTSVFTRRFSAASLVYVCSPGVRRPLSGTAIRWMASSAGAMNSRRTSPFSASFSLTRCTRARCRMTRSTTSLSRFFQA